MYYNVIVKNSYEYSGLVFHFGEDFKGALEFAEQILTISDYGVEILQFHEDDQKEE